MVVLIWSGVLKLHGELGVDTSSLFGRRTGGMTSTRESSFFGTHTTRRIKPGGGG